MTEKLYATWIEQQYRTSLIALSVLAIIFHPAFHFILSLLPNIPPDSLSLRLVSAFVSVVLLGVVIASPVAARYSAWLQVINAATAIIVTHLLVLNSGNHPMYLATSLTAVYGAQLSFVRVREWIITVAVVAITYVAVAMQRGMFFALHGYVPPLFYLANYIIATVLVAIRARSQFRELQARLALQQSNAELRNITDQLQNELALARDIQRSLLPPAMPAWPRFDVTCYCQPAQEVGGDFYSYYQFANGRVALAVGDVSGKGVSAALLMATSISLLNEHLTQDEEPDALLVNLDRSLLPYTQPRGQNCALCYVEIAGDTLRVVNAGGIPPYIRHTTGYVEWPEAGGFALGQGLGAQLGYRTHHVAIAPGDVIILISDGVVEAQDQHGNLFGFARVEQAFATGPTTSAQAMIDYLLTAVRAFVDTSEPHDDLTIVAVRVGA